MDSPGTETERRDDVSKSTPAGVAWLVFEVAAILMLMFLLCGERPPHVNESHYLTKAKHFWNPAWCAGDLFLDSPDAHHVFFITFGWLTKFFSLATTAWVGRIVCWLMFAIAWQRLSFRIAPQRFASVVSFGLMFIVITYFHLAGEWMVGGLEAKSVAYVGVLIALERLVAGKWKWVWIWLGIAGLFHVLVGGWSMIATLFVLVALPAGRQIFKKQLPWIVLGAVLILFASLPALFLNWGQPVEVTAHANQIYVRTRLPHHLYFWSFDRVRIFGFFLALAIWTALVFKTKTESPSKNLQLQRLNLFCLGAFLVGLMGVGLGYLSDRELTSVFADSLLRFYWFRLSDAAIAIGMALLSVAFGLESTKRQLSKTVFVVACIILITTVVDLKARDRAADQRAPADRAALETFPGDGKRTNEKYENWKKVCSWIKSNTPADAVFLTPIEQQTFNWYANRPQVYCRKDVPQDAKNMVEWERRLTDLYRGNNDYQIATTAELKSLANDYGFSFVIFDQAIVNERAAAGVPIELPMVYPAAPTQKVSYVVFKIN